MPSKARNDRHKGAGTLAGFNKGSGSSDGQSASDMASEGQVEYIRDLQAQCGYDLMTDYEARVLTVAEGARKIRSLLADVPPPDPDACPKNWDDTLWGLVLLFERYARADNIELRTNRSRIYTTIDELVTQWNMREKSDNGNYAQEVRGCARRELGEDMAERCWYHWPPHDPAGQTKRVLTWVEMVEVIMAELWSRVMNEHALEHFREHFAEYGMACTRHWRSLRIIGEIADQPRDHVRPVMRRRIPSGTMAADSKEG